MISVVIPTYKRPDLLERLLNSIFSQTMPPDEIIIVDDHSCMDKEYINLVSEKKKIFKNIFYIKNEFNRGAPASRNIGIKKSKSEWIAIVDDDDEWLPKKLELQCKDEYIKNPKLGIISCFTHIDDLHGRKNLKYIPKSYNPIKNILETNFIPSPAPIIRKSALIKAGLFDESLISCQDWDMWIRIFLEKYDYFIVKEFLTIYHKHDYESIGKSKKAILGYRRVIYKFKYLILLETSPINWIRMLFLFLKTFF